MSAPTKERKQRVKEQPLIVWARQNKLPTSTLEEMRGRLNTERVIGLSPLVESLSAILKFPEAQALVQFLVQIKPREDDLSKRIDSQIPWTRFACAYYRFWIEYGAALELLDFNAARHALHEHFVNQVTRAFPYCPDFSQYIAATVPGYFGAPSLEDNEKLLRALALYFGSKSNDKEEIQAAIAKYLQDWAKRLKYKGVLSTTSWIDLSQAMVRILVTYGKAVGLPEEANYKMIDAEYRRRNAESKSQQ